MYIDNADTGKDPQRLLQSCLTTRMALAGGLYSYCAIGGTCQHSSARIVLSLLGAVTLSAVSKHSCCFSSINNHYKSLLHASPMCAMHSDMYCVHMTK